MKQIFSLLVLFSLSCYLGATEKLPLNSGNKALDNTLLQINTKYSRRLKQFSQRISNEYMLPQYRLDNMISNYQFDPADIFLTVEIADLSGQPLDIVSRAYMENKQQGWGFVLKQLNILSSPAQLKQLKQDAEHYIK